MSTWVDRKYVMLVSGRLRNFKEKNSNLFNMSCPFCGDSKKNALRARGYIYERSGKMFYACHNCGLSTTFNNLLKHIDPISHREYVLEKFTKRHEKVKISSKPKEKIEVRQSQDLEPILSLPLDHISREYIASRKIPLTHWDDLYFTNNFKQFVTNSYSWKDSKRIENLPDDPRIVMFLTDLKGNRTHLNARAIHFGSEIRYVKLRIVPDNFERKVFGIQKIDFTKTIYVVEGEFDSMFLKNCVASGDSALYSLGRALYMSSLVPPDVVLIYDNEPRNAEITKQIKSSVEEGHKVVIWPDNTIGKDINEMVLNGKKPEQIQQIIVDNTFKGLEAMMMFNDWRKR